ncbi:MAG TPA: hypothetical protein VNQ73_08035 [Ilumatobacter sp.]|nr:hypothetical protein [Ilumatobacter sp.]
MDFSKFKTHDWLVIGGGLGILIFGFVNWIKVSGFGFSSSGGNAFDFFFTGTVPWILLVAAAVVTFLRVQGTLKDNLPWPLIILGATALSALLLLIRFIFNPIEGKDFIEAGGGSVGRGIGLIISFIAGIVSLVGGVLGFQASGGDLKDLRDVNKLKGSFGGES